MREKTIYEKIAEKYNTTPEEVRREMQIAIDAGFDNPVPPSLICKSIKKTRKTKKKQQNIAGAG